MEQGVIENLINAQLVMKFSTFSWTQYVCHNDTGLNYEQLKFIFLISPLEYKIKNL